MRAPRDVSGARSSHIGNVESYEVDDFTDPSTDADETVLIQHGIGRNVVFWRHWVPGLASTYRVVRRNLPGHGAAPLPPDPFGITVDGLVSDLCVFIESLGVAPVHYLGESTGGILGVLLAERRPDLVASLTLCSTPLSVPVRGTVAAGREDLAVAVAELGSEGWMRWMMDKGIISRGRSATYADWAIDQGRRVSEAAFVAIAAAASGVDLRQHLPNIRVPVLVLAPTRSPLTTLEDQVAMRLTIPRAEIAVVEGPTHEIYVDRSRECISAVRRFLDHTGGLSD